MTEAYIGEIRVFPFDFAPRNWALCNGQLLPINNNQALFAILGTTYGGNGTTTFALPDLQGRVPVHAARSIVLGEAAGEEQHTLTPAELPSHTHLAHGNKTTGGEGVAAGNVWGATTPASVYASEGSTLLSPSAVAPAGASQPHANMQPTLVTSYCICVQGIFPSRS